MQYFENNSAKNGEINLVLLLSVSVQERQLEQPDRACNINILKEEF